MGIENGSTRRDFLTAVGSAALAVACKGIPNLETQPDAEKKESDPQMGDIIVIGNNAQLLSNELRYQIRDLPTYLRRSKTKGKVHTFKNDEEARGIFAQYPQGKYKSFEFGLGQGDVKRENQDGGEKLILIQGFLSSDSRPYLQIIPRKDTFIALRKRLKADGWDPDPSDPRLKDILFLDSYIFTYSEDELKTQSLAYTFESPEKINDIARSFIKKLIERSPFDQNNGFGHSLGGIYVLEMAMAYPFAFNNLIIVNSPILGLDLNILQKAGIGILRENLSQFGIDPTKVIDYLSKLWGDERKNKLKQFFHDFTKRGGKVLIVYTEGDVIVTRDSTGIDEFKNIGGVETLTVNAGNVNPFNPIDVFNAHGLALGHEKFLTASSAMIGKNLSTS